MSEENNAAFLSLREAVRSGTGAVNVSDIWEFRYKGRRTYGQAIHVAALDPEGGTYIEALLTARAAVDVEAYHAQPQRNFKLVSYMQPLHLAAGSGHIDVMRTLLRQDKNLINKKTRQQKQDLDGKELDKMRLHYCPIHDAVFRQKESAVRFLLEQRADINMQNILLQTPLHISAMKGQWDMVKMLRDGRADVTKIDIMGDTPLVTAILKSQDKNKLYLLMTPRLCELRAAAEEDAGAALELLKDKKWWKRELEKEAKESEEQGTKSTKMASDLAKLIRVSPLVASEVLGVLTEEPVVESPWTTPLPRHSKEEVLAQKPVMYMVDKVWRELERSQVIGMDLPRHFAKRSKLDDPQDSDEEESETVTDSENPLEGCQPQVVLDGEARQRACGMRLDGGSRLLEGPVVNDPKEKEGQAISIRVLNLPNVFCMDVLRALAECTSPDQLVIFKSAAAQAILDFAWAHLVRDAYSMDVLLRGAELFALFWVAANPHHGAVSQKNNPLWSFFMTMAMRDLILELAQMRQDRWRLRNVKNYFMDHVNYLDLSTILLVCCFTLTLPFSPEGFSAGAYRKMLAAISVLKWYQVLNRLGAYGFKQLGSQIICIFQSQVRIIGILVITFFLFVALVQAYTALGSGHDDVVKIILSAFRLLFLGDDHGIDLDFLLSGVHDRSAACSKKHLSMADAPGPSYEALFGYGSTLIFCICVMNLFIAGLTDAYSSVAKEWEERFYSNRASVCAEALVLPRLPGSRDRCRRRRSRGLYMAIMTVGGLVWYALISMPGMCLWLPVLWLLTTIMMGDLWLRRRPWDDHCHHCGWRQAMKDLLPGFARSLSHDGNGGNENNRAYAEILEYDGESEDDAHAPPQAEQGQPWYLLWCNPADHITANAQDPTLNALQAHVRIMESKFGEVNSRLHGLENILANIVSERGAGAPGRDNPVTASKARSLSSRSHLNLGFRAHCTSSDSR
mmetsp:Transcript_32309/g.82269  ORF Transcript_32309/g.82269 Transcript_32309/m.82269 type:complete len:963 (-) Transcript_32309:87-2975(-)